MINTSLKRWRAATAALLTLFAFLTLAPAQAQIPDPRADLRAAAAQAQLDKSLAEAALKAKRQPFEDRLKVAEDDLEKAKASGADTTALATARDKIKAELSADEEIKKLEAEVTRTTEDLAKKKKLLDDAEEAEKQRLKAGNEKIYEGTLALLTMFLVLAIVLENALEVIFKWRVFQIRYSSRGMKAPIMVLAAGAMVLTFKLDILANLVALYKSDGVGVPPQVKSNFFTGLISAFVLAGGSAGVNRLMVALGVRKESQPVIVPKPPENKAWIAIKLKRVFAVGDLLVHLDKMPAPEAPADTTTTGATGATGAPAPAPAPAKPAPPNQLVGTIRNDLQTAREIMLRNKDRFPQNGGCEVDTVSTYKITVTGTSADGTPLKKELGPYSFAPGAIVDFEVTL
jgi:hypothetical protein